MIRATRIALPLNREFKTAPQLRMTVLRGRALKPLTEAAHRDKTVWGEHETEVNAPRPSPLPGIRSITRFPVGTLRPGPGCPVAAAFREVPVMRTQYRCGSKKFQPRYGL
jgi:hypothetical protein